MIRVEISHGGHQFVKENLMACMMYIVAHAVVWK